MKNIPALLLFFSISLAAADTVTWGTYRGLVSKSYDESPAAFQITTDSNAVVLSLQQVEESTSMFGASQWGVDRWPGAPPFDGNQFNIVTNASNDIVLGLWGFYGEDGFGANTTPMLGDFTTHRLSIIFAQPVTDLAFQINTINALIKSTGFNSNDILTISAFLGSNAVASPTYSNEGTAYTRNGDVLTGDFANRMPEADPGQHTSNGGSLTVNFGAALDRIELTLKNIVDHEDPSMVQPGFDDPNSAQVEGLQTWAFSVNNLSFHTIPEPSSGLLSLVAFSLLFRRRK